MPPAADPPQDSAAPDRGAVQAEMDQARREFRRLLAQASTADLRRASDGTKWSNQELLYHMLLGYLVVRALLPLARLVGRLPGRASQAFARLLDLARRPFHLINYLGSRAGARIIPPANQPGLLDWVTAALERRLQQETDTALRQGMHYPTTWDPLFTGYMTLAELYRYPSLHFWYHHQQLTMPEAADCHSSGSAGSALSGAVSHPWK